MYKIFATKYSQMVIETSFPYQILFGTSLCKETAGDKLITCATDNKVSPQNEFDNFVSERKHLTLSIKVLFILLAKSLSWRVLGGVLCCLIPWCLQYSSNVPQYSPLLGVRIHFSFFQVTQIAWRHLTCGFQSSRNRSKVFLRSCQQKWQSECTTQCHCLHWTT